MRQDRPKDECGDGCIPGGRWMDPVIRIPVHEGPIGASEDRVDVDQTDVLAPRQVSDPGVESVRWRNPRSFRSRRDREEHGLGAAGPNFIDHGCEVRDDRGLRHALYQVVRSAHDEDESRSRREHGRQTAEHLVRSIA